MVRLLRSLVSVMTIALVMGTAIGTDAQTPDAGLEWQPCPAPFPTSATPVVGPADYPPGLECATVLVPLDYDDPDGEQITIGLNRLPATNRDARIGSLIFNPGGPGGPGTYVVALEAIGVQVFTPAVREHFDVVGMDPRGTGTSTPVRCDPALWNETPSLLPADEAAFAQLREWNRAFGQSCLDLTGPLLGHVDTTSVARDLEAVRAALDEGGLNYLGLSYGAQLGTAYAELFPGNIRVMALDGALDHGREPAAMLADEAAAYDRELGRFAEWCAETAECALHGEDVLADFAALVERAGREPIPAPACETSGACRATVTGEDIRLFTQSLLLFKDATPAFGLPGWAGLAEALAAAEGGDASTFARGNALSDTHGSFARLAIECVDWKTPATTFDDLMAKRLLAGIVAPHTQGSTQTWTILTGCTDWPVPVSNPPRPADVQGAPAILIINAVYDPSTACVWAHGLLEQIDGSVLLTRVGDGHTSYLLPGESQTRDAIDTYLITGETPPPNSVYES